MHVTTRLVLSLPLVSLALFAHGATSEAIAPSPGTMTEAKLRSLSELRQLDVLPRDANEFSFDKPGLTLIFDVAVPEGRTLMAIEQPVKVEARDVAGTNLAAIEADFMGDKTYVEVVESWGEPPRQFEFTLALPARSAATFDLSAELTAVTFARVETVEAALSTDSVTLDAAPFGGAQVTARLINEGGSPHVEIRPGSVRDQLEALELLSGDAALETSMSMWNDESVTYMFDGAHQANMTLRLKVRAGLERSPLVINLDDQPLP